MFAELFKEVYIVFNAFILGGLAAVLPFYAVYQFGKAVWKRVKEQQK
ncbi:MAG: hypothetical protein ACOX36_06630 [Saccharofermentanales bacterium]|jgi:uncharacterized membrane protein